MAGSKQKRFARYDQRDDINLQNARDSYKGNHWDRPLCPDEYTILYVFWRYMAFLADFIEAKYNKQPYEKTK